MSMKTLKELQGKAQHLSNCLPEGAVFSIDSAFDGYRFHFDNGNGPVSCCGYERKSVVLAQFQAISTALDGIHRSKCTEEVVKSQLDTFLTQISPITNTLEDELVVVLELAGALMRQLNPDKTLEVLNKIVSEYQERFQFEMDEEAEALERGYF